MRDILFLVMRRGLWQITCGLALGLLAAFPLTHLMASIPNGSLHSDPSVIFEVALTLASVGVFACWLPARRATGLDPVRAIRYE
jgi:ABC-type antimicrobial peptide transport system permease subunit